jgi:hypothetical protein
VAIKTTTKPFCKVEEKVTDQDTEWIALMISAMVKARKIIIEDITARKSLYRDIKGEVKCPICEEGQIVYTYAGAYNKHISAKCSTTDCVNWIE